jgi:hypothetical protein
MLRDLHDIPCRPSPQGPESKFDEGHSGPPPALEDRPTMVATGKHGTTSADGPSIREGASLQG